MKSILFLFIVVFEVTQGVKAETDCIDKSQFCASWKTSGFCRGIYEQYMKTNCRKACGLCIPKGLKTTVNPYPNCQNAIGYCSDYTGYCQHPSYVKYLQKNCKKFCNYCHITTTSPPITKARATNVYTVPGGSQSLQPGCGRKGPGHTRIVGGVAAKPGEWPWIVTFDYVHNTANPGHYCGGTLITDEWILSAAHCFYDDQVTSKYSLKLGEHNLKTNSGHEQSIPIAKILFHPNYDHNTYNNDLALVKLARKAKLNDRVKTACLPDHNTSFAIGEKCYISGWGKLSSYGIGPQILQQAKVPLVNHQTCKNSHTHLVSDKMLCAGYAQGGVDACQGDSGGPLVCKASDDTWYLWGVVSWGVGCGRAYKYGVYANTKVLRRWVDQVVFKSN